MPIAKVQLPDGRIGRFEVPEGTTPEQVTAFANQQFAPQSSAQPATPVTQSAPVPDDGLFSQLRQRGATMANLDTAVESGQKIRPEVQFEKAGEFAGGIGDVIGEGVKGAYHALMTDKGEARISSDLKRLAGTPVGRAGLEALKTGGEIWDTYKQANPRTADLLVAGANIVGVVPIGSAAKGGMNVVKGIELPKIRKAPSPIKSLLNADEVRTIASLKYKEAADKGGILKPEFTNKFIDEVQSIKPRTKKGQVLAGNTELENTLKKIETFRDTPFSLEEAQDVDEILGDIIDGFVDKQTGKLDKQGTKIYEIQSRFRNSIENAGASMIEGGGEGFKALKDGRKLWSTSRKMADIERIISRAEGMNNPATAMKTGFNTLYHSPNRIRGYSASERQLIKRAATDSAVADLLRTTLASRLVPIIGGATGGVGAGVAGQAASMAARGASNRVQLNKANKILQELSKDVKKGE